MTLLIIGLVIFFAVHLVPAMTGLKQSLKDRFGDNGYRGVFTVISLVGFVLIIWGYARAEWADVYFPPDWGRSVTMILVLLAFILLAAANMKGRIRKTLKHPMLIGILLWGRRPPSRQWRSGERASVRIVCRLRRCRYHPGERTGQSGTV